MALAWATTRPALAFAPSVPLFQRTTSSALALSTSATTGGVSLEHCLSRLDVLQKLLQKQGAPGSAQCTAPNDLEPLEGVLDTPELVSSLGPPDPTLANLHPYLVPLAKSTQKAPGSYICAYRNPAVEAADIRHPWPIVEAAVGSPGMRLLALNSEHLMRRMAAAADEVGNTAVIDLYNQGLGKGAVADPALDVPYQVGSVAKLGYGVEKYVLLRVGPFADLYQSMAAQHAARDDEASALIAAEAANSKLAGFGSNFLYYAELLSTFPNRVEEARDAARMCLRLPLATVGLTTESLQKVAVLSQAASADDSPKEALAKLSDLYEKIKQVETEDNTGQADGKTVEQMAMDEATAIMDRAILSGQDWSAVRPAVAEKFRSIGRDDFARFVELQN